MQEKVGVELHDTTFTRNHWNAVSGDSMEPERKLSEPEEKWKQMEPNGTSGCFHIYTRRRGGRRQTAIISICFHFCSIRKVVFPLDFHIVDQSAVLSCQFPTSYHSVGCRLFVCLQVAPDKFATTEW